VAGLLRACLKIPGRDCALLEQSQQVLGHSEVGRELRLERFQM
jgi:hypothetical protein